MKYAVEILPLAEEDIQRNAQWWADHHSVDQAVKSIARTLRRRPS